MCPGSGTYRTTAEVEEMGDEWGRVSFRLDRELIEEYAAELWGMKIDYVDVARYQKLFIVCPYKRSVNLIRSKN